MVEIIKTPIADDVRLNTAGDPKLKDITSEVRLQQKAMEKPAASKAPPSAHRDLNLFRISLQLSHRLFTTGLKPITNSLPEMLFFCISHLILLYIFFLIAIFKNFQFAYRKSYLKVLSLTYYPNKSPQIIRDDVNKLKKIPKSVACILDLKEEGEENGGKDGFISQISELAAWTVSAGIGRLVIYEYTGALNQNYEGVVDLSKSVVRNFISYYGSEAVPKFSIKVPHKNLILYSDESIGKNPEGQKPVDLQIDLLSRVDGKPTLVELTRTMSELAVNGELSINDITIDLIDEELVELVGPEPDLLICFAPSLNFQDYPPWHIRLTEIFWEPDNKDVNYAVFIRALKQFSSSKVNVGR
ncbi:uncharacterized protein LODBEIA_P33350 [Lodderomyces beijingensis]|uniref:ditrans,polycis-polyprenyl diphosphate synthase [(2E,6E)-farnesyldiphosphate specific] n=1 Tax=Lodderomyces beijingensis TaxID=1775926 RepID=A0ABP0ZPR8_9ASCO